MIIITLKSAVHAMKFNLLKTKLQILWHSYMHNNVRQKSGQMTVRYAEGFWKTVLTLRYENLAVILNSFF